MMIHPTPITLPDLACSPTGTPAKSPSGSNPGFQAGNHQFWYWYGASGRKYIHSVYDPEHCPPLPGAIYLAVKVNGANRDVLAIGRFPKFANYQAVSKAWTDLKSHGADEIHVHLLAKSHEAAQDIIRDLRQACGLAAELQPCEVRPGSSGTPAASKPEAEKPGNVVN